jgi:hypothetical protein
MFIPLSNEALKEGLQDFSEKTICLSLEDSPVVLGWCIREYNDKLVVALPLAKKFSFSEPEPVGPGNRVDYSVRFLPYSVYPVITIYKSKILLVSLLKEGVYEEAFTRFLLTSGNEIVKGLLSDKNIEDLTEILRTCPKFVEETVENSEKEQEKDEPITFVVNYSGNA